MHGNVMTIRNRILECLKWEPYKHGATASQMWHYLNVLHVRPQHNQYCVRWDGQLWTCDSDCQITFPTTKFIKLSSLSSALKKMYDAGELDRYGDFGVRGGFGYVLGKKSK